MSFEGVDTSSVADALWEGANGGASPEQAPVPAAEPATQPAPVSPTEVEAGLTPEESFTKLDPNALPEELLPYYKQMQGDYTRKTQEVAQQRKQLESLGVEPNQAAEAVQFYNALQNDPNFAVQVHQALTQQLQGMGYGLADAQALATQQMNQPGPQDFTPDYGVENEFGSDPRDAMIADMYQRMEQFEQQQQVSAYAAELQRQDMAIRQSHPDYTQSDMDRVYELAMAHDGDLMQANNVYQQWKSDVLAGYLNQKAAAPQSIPTAPTAAGQQPAEIKDLSQAKAAAREMLLNSLGG